MNEAFKKLADELNETVAFDICKHSNPSIRHRVAAEFVERVKQAALAYDREQMNRVGPCGKHPTWAWIPGPHPDDDYCFICKEIESLKAERDKLETLYKASQQALGETLDEHAQSEAAHVKVTAQNLEDFRVLAAQRDQAQAKSAEMALVLTEISKGECEHCLRAEIAGDFIAGTDNANRPLLDWLAALEEIKRLNEETIRNQQTTITLLNNQMDKQQARIEALERVRERTIVCLCGSTRFYRAFQEANYSETMAGRIVLTVGFYPHASEEMHGQHIDISGTEKDKLDELHKRKIDLADEVLVLNVGGYIGDSTRSEIEYATIRQKPIRYLEALAAVDEKEGL